MSIGIVASSYVAAGGGGGLQAAISALSPVAYWPLQESSGDTFEDVSGNGNDAVRDTGTITYGVTINDNVSGITGASARLTAADFIWPDTDTSIIVFGIGQITGTDFSFVGRWSATPATPSRFITRTSGDRFQYYSWVTGQIGGSGTDTSDVDTTPWMYGLTVDLGGNMVGYKNGSADRTQSVGAAWSVTNLQTAYLFTRTDGIAVGNATMAHAAIFDKALTPTEISNLYSTFTA